MLRWMNRSTAGGKSRAEKIAAMVEKIAGSDLSVDEFFRRYTVPFSRPQYFRYQARLAAQGLAGLLDGRRQGNRRKLTPEAEAFLRGAHQSNPQRSLQEMCQSLYATLGIEVDRSTVGRFLHRVGESIVWPRPQEPERVTTSGGGFEILAALALHLGWVAHTAEVIAHSLARFRRSAAYRQERVGKDRKGRRAGRFTVAYNQRRDVREQRFASVEEKREDKNYSRMGLFQVSGFILERKCLGILAFPLITLNGGTRSANVPLGNALEHFCGFNYQHHTLDKFLRELKYLGLAEDLLRDQVGFWQEHWRKLGERSELPFLCYYVDGNTKALWSQKRVKQNKVTMLGRVMGCLEQVFVHDAFGHPVYLEPYAGKAPLGARILGLMEKIEEALEGPGPPLRVTRVIVMDAASNGVATLRAFAEQDRYHYITALDDNQWNPRKVREQGRAKRYYYGEATLRDCQLELEDSREKGNLVAGYGKKKLSDETVRAKQKELGARIPEWRKKLAVPLEAMAGQEERLALSMEKQRRIHARCPIVKGRRVVEEESQVRLTSLGREIAQYRRQMKSIQAEWGKDLKRLRNYEQQWLRLQGKDFVYQIDVELDQIMGFFRISLVNLSCWFLRECLGRSSMSLSKLLHTILLMPAEIELTKEVRRVKLRRNPKDPEGMKKLEPALERLNELRIQHLDQKRIEFVLG